MEYLEKHSLFKSMQVEEMKHLIQSAMRLQLKKDSVLFREEEPSTGIYVVREGIIKIYKNLPEANFVLSLAKEGDCVGLDSVLSGKLNLNTAIAAQDCVVYFIPRKLFCPIIEKYPHLSIDVMRYMSRKINLLENRIYAVNRKKILSHFAELIKSLSEISHNKIIAPDIVSVNDISNLLGTTNNYVYKLIQQLEDRGAIQFKERKLKIASKEMLKKIMTEEDEG